MTLLVGYPGGDRGHSGLELAAQLARSSGDALHVVTVVPAGWPTPGMAKIDGEYKAWAREHGDRAVAEARAYLAERAPDIEADIGWLAHRSVPAALIEETARREARMIVAGSGSDGPHGHVVVASVTGRLLHSSPVPVALATRGYRAASDARITRVTCAFRGDELSREVLARTAVICDEVGASLRVVTFAVRGRTMYPPEIGAGIEDQILAAWREQSIDAQREALAGLEVTGQRPGDVECEVASGRSWADAIDRLPWSSDDVLVVGSSRESLAARVFLGSSATKIIRQAPVPVVLVPAAAG